MVFCYLHTVSQQHKLTKLFHSCPSLYTSIQNQNNKPKSFFIFSLQNTTDAFFAGGKALNVVARRKRIALWSASIVGGACIELCTVLKKDVGNFYHSQAIIMLLGRRVGTSQRQDMLEEQDFVEDKFVL